jgi:3-oxoadipate enol-lactonase
MPFVEVGNLRAHYELAESDNPVLMFSNSLGTDISMWERQLPELSQCFRVLRYDTRGHGQSSVTPGEYTIEQLGRDAVSILDYLGLDRVHFCGLSMGGMIGIWLGIHAPDRVHRLVLSNTAARIGTQEMWNSRIAMVHNDGMKPVAAAVIERWLTPEFRSSFPQETARAQRMLENSPPAGYAACCAAVRDMDQRDEVAKIKIPTLIIYGTKDPVSPVSDSEFLHTQIEGSELVGLAAAHLSNVEQPDAFTKTVNDFLSR